MESITLSVYCVRKISQIAGEYAKEFNIIFYPLKCHSISDNINKQCIKVNDINMNSETKGIHIGNKIGHRTKSDMLDLI